MKMKQLAMVGLLVGLLSSVAYAFEAGDYVPQTYGDSSVTVTDNQGNSETYVTSV